MPHIHTNPGDHDLTASAYIVRLDEGEPKGLVHMHRKLGWLMQVGGHVETQEDPWQSIAHELAEEAGYRLDELKILQPTAHPLDLLGGAVHPTPFIVNTHPIGTGGVAEHLHTDLCYAFLASGEPSGSPAEGESQDLRWLTSSEIREAASDRKLIGACAILYQYIFDELLNSHIPVDTSEFTLGGPTSKLTQ